LHFLHGEIAMTTQDTIVREFTVPISQRSVWAAITQPEHISKWFGSNCTGTIAVGEIVIFSWESEESRARIEAIEPKERFAFSWQPGSGKNSGSPFRQLHVTLVEFLLTPFEGGTRVTMYESGFASLPEAMHAGVVADNTWGWDLEVAELEVYLLGMGQG